MVNGILDMSKIETGNFEIPPEPFAPGQVIADCCDMLALKARDAGIDLVVRCPADLPEIVADKRALKQIMLNLLSNAIKFTNRGGRVTVGAEVDGDLIVRHRRGHRRRHRRRGPCRASAIRSSRRGRAYDRRHDGTGLGLSIVKGLVALHGGESRSAAGSARAPASDVRLPLDCEQRTRRTRPAADTTVVELPVTRAANHSRQEPVRKSA